MVEKVFGHLGYAFAQTHSIYSVLASLELEFEIRIYIFLKTIQKKVTGNLLHKWIVF